MSSYTDLAGTAPRGTATLTINAVTYICEDLDFRRPSDFIARRNASDQPAGGHSQSDFETGTATLQLAADTTAVPTLHDTFTHDADGDSTAETWWISEVGQPRRMGELWTCNISFQRKVTA